MNLEYQGLLVALRRTSSLLFIDKESGYCSVNIFLADGEHAAG